MSFFVLGELNGRRGHFPTWYAVSREACGTGSLCRYCELGHSELVPRTLCGATVLVCTCAAMCGSWALAGQALSPPHPEETPETSAYSLGLQGMVSGSRLSSTWQKFGFWSLKIPNSGLERTVLVSEPRAGRGPSLCLLLKVPLSTPTPSRCWHNGNCTFSACGGSLTEAAKFRRGTALPGATARACQWALWLSRGAWLSQEYLADLCPVNSELLF